MLYKNTTGDAALDKELDSLRSDLDRLRAQFTTLNAKVAAPATSTGTQVFTGPYVRTVSKTYQVTGDLTFTATGALTLTQAANNFAFDVPFAVATPLAASGAGAVGTSLKLAREDHVHPTTGLGRLVAGNITIGALTTAVNFVHNLATNDILVAVWSTGATPTQVLLTLATTQPDNNTVTINMTVAQFTAGTYRVVVVG